MNKKALISICVLIASCSEAPDTPRGSTSATSGSGGAAGAGEGGAAGNGGNGGDGAAGAGGAGGAPEATGPIRYPPGLRHSPLAKTVVEKGKAILASGTGRQDVFAKIGDSNTVNTGFLNGLSGNDVQLDSHTALQPTIDYFKQKLVDGTKTSFNRPTLAAKVGWSSGDLLTGSPNPIDDELAAITPAFAVVMLGTNDTYVQGIEPFGNNMLRIVDLLVSKGVVPLLTTIPQRADTVDAEKMVPEMNALVRAVAQARQVPMLDLFGALEPIPGHGLVSDGIHLQTYSNSSGSHSCWFDANGLTEGMNQRNLITLEALDRSRRFFIENEVPENRPADIVGEGTWASPYEIDALPFVDDRNTQGTTTSEVDKYSCSMANEGGPEIVYRLKLETPKNLRIRVVDDAATDIDVHFLSDPGGANTCLTRSDKVLDVTAGPGTYWISADTYVDAAGTTLTGPYLLTVLEM
ncbi:MAG TPA: SGNH/GDSL hydrolase family protein [Polyangium sp.]|nr:SGNH/GDSL hydrolase family protein [Polyangium sp.]